MPITIGLWGPSESGKTAYLCQLYFQLIHSDWTVYPTLDAEKFLNEARPKIAQNRFPPATNVGTHTNITYALESPTGAEYLLSLTDQAGEDLMQLAGRTRTELNAADALLILLDSEEAWQEIESKLEGVLTTLHADGDRGVKRDPRPVGICLTKIDKRLSNYAELDLATRDPRAFVLSRIDARLEPLAHRFLMNYEFFPVSAAGVFSNEGFLMPATFYDEKLELRLAAGGESVNLLLPLVWVIEHLEPGKL